MKLQKISNIPSNLTKAGLEFEAVDLEHNGNIVPAIRISGGKDEIKYNRVKFDSRLYVDVESQYGGNINIETKYINGIPVETISGLNTRISTWDVFDTDTWSLGFGISDELIISGNNMAFKYFGLTILPPRFPEYYKYNSEYKVMKFGTDSLHLGSNISITKPNDDCTMQNMNNPFSFTGYLYDYNLTDFTNCKAPDKVWFFGSIDDSKRTVTTQNAEIITPNNKLPRRTENIGKFSVDGPEQHLYNVSYDCNGVIEGYKEVTKSDQGHPVTVIETIYKQIYILNPNGSNSSRTVDHIKHFGEGDLIEYFESYYESETYGKFKNLPDYNFLGNGGWTGDFHINGEYKSGRSTVITTSRTYAKNRIRWEGNQPVIVPMSRLDRFPFVFNVNGDTKTILNYKTDKSYYGSTPMPTINTNPTDTQTGRITVQFELFDKTVTLYFNIIFETRNSHCLYKGDSSEIGTDVKKEFQSIDVWEFTENDKKYFINKDGFVEEKKN
jgi:hypothetical protein